MHLSIEKHVPPSHSSLLCSNSLEICEDSVIAHLLQLLLSLPKQAIDISDGVSLLAHSAQKAGNGTGLLDPPRMQPPVTTFPRTRALGVV